MNINSSISSSTLGFHGVIPTSAERTHLMRHRITESLRMEKTSKSCGGKSVIRTLLFTAVLFTLPEDDPLLTDNFESCGASFLQDSNAELH